MSGTALHGQFRFIIGVNLMAISLPMLSAEVDGIIARSAGDHGKFLECRACFEEVLRAGLHVDQLHRLLERVRSDQPILTYGPYVVLHLDDHCSWAIVQHPARMPGASLVPNHSLEARIAEAPLAVQRQILAGEAEIGNVGPGAALIQCVPEYPAPGEVIVRNGHREALAIAGSNGRPSLTLRLTSAFFGEYEWGVDARTLTVSQAFSTRERESFVMTIFDLLASAGSPRSLDVLDRFSNHPLHYVRWKAIQAIAEIDGGEGARLVARALDDPDPGVREAARAATGLIETAKLEPMEI